MEKNKITTVLFGLDGVIVDTRKSHDDFWNMIAERNDLKIENFPSVIDGMTTNSILDLYFAINTPEEKQAIREEEEAFNASLDFKNLVIPNVLEFIKYLKENNYKIGLVTSSSKSKVARALEQLGVEDAFDTIITAESIKKGKPDPMGFVLAQTNLGVKNTECVVFEDAFTGIKAATYAFMRVIGVATTLSEDFLKDYTYGVISDFTDMDKLKGFLDK